MKNLIVTAILLISSVSSASTFVGNGGNIGDIELQVTLQQLSQTFNAIIENKNNVQENLCTCSPAYEGRPLCETLKQLSPVQVKFCADYIRSKAPELAEKTANKSRVRFNWTQDVIEVRESGHLRGVDAVTNIRDNSMTLNQKNYLAMSVDERTFLLGHEMFHFTKHEGMALTDEGDIGPFKGADGKRQFINAMAASLVMTANDLGVFRVSNAALRRSQASRQWWVSLGTHNLTPSYNQENPFGVDRLSGSEFSVRHQFTPEWGALFDIRNLRGKRNRMTQIEGNEDRQAVGIGVAYRYFPKDNPLTFWGQAHLVVAATVDTVKTTYTLRSAHTWLEEKASGNGFTLSAKYYVPFRKSFWGYAGLSYSDQKLHLPETDIKYTSGSTAGLGVSYGF